MPLISGLIEPTEGAVMMDGVDLRQIDKSDIRRNIGVMLQDTWLFSGSIKENLQMGYYEYDDAHILDIATFTSSFSSSVESRVLTLETSGGGVSSNGTISGSQQITDFGFISSSVGVDN